MSTTIEERLKSIITSVDERGYITSREASDLEYKESFILKSLGKYLKSFAAFSNAHGGLFIFGISDSPRKPVGIDKVKFDEISQEKITGFINEYFAPYIEWSMGITTIDKKHYGYVYINECSNKPTICKKNNGDDLKEGAIYFRYRGQSRTIGFPELKKIHEDIRESEKNLWMQHVERIAKIGPKNVALLNLYDGTVSKDGTNKLVLSKDLLDELKGKVSFIQEGKFVEKDGSPAFIIKGTITSADEVIVADIDPNKDYPYLTGGLSKKLKIRPYDAQVLIWKFKLRGNKKYHFEVESSKDSKVNRYSEEAVKRLQAELKSAGPDCLKKLSKEYSDRVVNKKTS